MRRLDSGALLIDEVLQKVIFIFRWVQRAAGGLAERRPSLLPPRVVLFLHAHIHVIQRVVATLVCKFRQIISNKSGRAL